MSAPDVFISYARADAETARRFADAFRADGLDVWWDNALQAGEVFDEAIEAALRAARAVVVLWSKKSVISRWVRAEATLAERKNTLIPVMIEPCERPIIFELVQTADLTGWVSAFRAWRAHDGLPSLVRARAAPRKSGFSLRARRHARGIAPQRRKRAGQPERRAA